MARRSNYLATEKTKKRYYLRKEGFKAKLKKRIMLLGVTAALCWYTQCIPFASNLKMKRGVKAAERCALL